MTGLKEYAKSVAAEYALSFVASVCLIVVSLAGFVVDPALQFNVALIGVLSAALLAICYAGAFRKGAMLWAIGGYALFGVAAIAVGIATSTGADIMADIEENHLAFSAVIVVVNVAVFLLSRTRLGFLALFACALFACAYVEFVFHAGLALPSIAGVTALAMLFVYRSFMESVYAADSVDRPDFGRAAGIACGSVAACCLVAVAAYALVVAPLNPGHLSVKLFTEERSLETVYISNPVRIEKVEDPSMTTSEVTDEVIYGNNPIEVDGTGLSQGATANFIENAVEVAQQAGGYRFETDDEGVDLYTFEIPAFWYLLAAIVPVALLVGAVIGRKCVRARRRTRIVGLAPAEQVGAMYGDISRKLGKLGIGRPASLTPSEFAESSQARMASFCVQSSGDDWKAMSEAFVKAHYGMQPPTGEQVAACWRFYDGFYANAVRLVGRLKYCLKYFWIL